MKKKSNDIEKEKQNSESETEIAQDTNNFEV